MEINGRNVSDPWICGTYLLSHVIAKNAAVTFRVTRNGLRVTVKGEEGFYWTRRFTAGELSGMTENVAEEVGRLMAEEGLVRELGHVTVDDVLRDVPEG